MAEHEEAHLLWRLRARIAATSLRHALRTARFRVSLAIFLSVVFWIGLFLLTYGGFAFLRETAGANADDTIRHVFNLFYASLMVMLVFSTAIILYGGIYRGPEAEFLLTTPTSAQRVFVYKFQEALLFSSWGFLLLGSPLLIAHGMVAGAPWHFYLLLVPFLLAFVFIPASLGAIVCLAIVHYLARYRKPALVAAGGLVVLAVILIGWSIVTDQESNLLTHEWFLEMDARLSNMENRLLPSWWLSQGLLEAARPERRSLAYQPWAQAILFLSLLISNALFLHQVAVWTAGKIYRASYSRLRTEHAVRRRRATNRRQAATARGIPLLPLPIRLLLIKDLRIFRRDPAQWSQFLIFFGLLGLYFVNIQRVSYASGWVQWVNVVGFMNVSVVGLILATFMTRFIFPMISLEGRRFWILGLLPIERDTILWGKFLFAAVGSIVPSALLILLSDLMLGILTPVILVHQFSCVLLCLGLSAIAVGMGANMPDLRETSPSKIAAGFGGTLNLVVSAIYILLIVSLTGVPSYIYILTIDAQPDAAWQRGHGQWLLTAGIVVATALASIATLFPLRSGIRAFRKMEF